MKVFWEQPSHLRGGDPAPQYHNFSWAPHSFIVHQEIVLLHGFYITRRLDITWIFYNIHRLIDRINQRINGITGLINGLTRRGAGEWVGGGGGPEVPAGPTSYQ